MTRMIWDDNRPYITGVDQGVLYPEVGMGVSWSGLVDVTYTPTGGELQPRFFDGVRIAHDQAPEQFKATIHAVTCPDILFTDVLYQDRRNPFGMSYRETTDSGFLIHLVYNARVDPTTMLYQHRVVAPVEFDIEAVPIAVPNSKPSAHLVIDTGRASIEAVTALEDILYGTAITDPRLPLPSETLTLFDNNMDFKVVDNGDGTFTVIATDGSIVMLDDTTFQITTDNAVYIDTESYTLHSF